MSLTKEFFNRETNISAKVVCDSIDPSLKNRITTFEIEYPRFILAELNTHKALDKNSSSSRAIPIKAMIDQIDANGGLPLYWGKAKAGMQAGEEIDGFDLYHINALWNGAKENAISSADVISQLGLHKQTANRLLEPFQMMKTVITGTDWDNFFNLRIHPDAQPEFCMLAYKMYEAMKASDSKVLDVGEWHLPYVEWRFNNGKLEYGLGDKYSDDFKILTLEEAQRVSASCTAQTSYRKSDDSLEKADKVFKMLIDADVLHASPFGHLATPVGKELYIEEDTGCSYDVNERLSVNLKGYPSTWEKGVTHMRRDGTLCSGNLRGWISYRHLLPNNTCWKYDHEKRMELFK